MNLSVIVTVFNIPEKLLKCCLKSLQNQSYQDTEFIIVNDGSSDPECEKIIKSFCKNDSRFVYIYQENSGVSVARNTGISVSNGDYLMFVDGDDSLTNEAIAKAIDKIQETAADCIIFGFNEIQENEICEQDPNGKYYKSLSDKDIESLILDIISFDTSYYTKYNVSVDSPWGKIFKREIIRDNGILFNPLLSRSEDALFCIQYYDNCKTIEIFSESIYNYTYNIDSLCRGTSDIIVRMLPCIAKCFKEYLEFRYKDDDRFINKLSRMIEKYILVAEERYFFSKSNTKSMVILLKEYKNLLNSVDICKLISNKASQKHRRISNIHRLSWVTPLCISYFLIMRIRCLLRKLKLADIPAEDIL